MSDIERSLAQKIAETGKKIPLILLSGPMESGKTFLIRSMFGGQFNYFSMKSENMRSMAIEHPESFLELNRGRTVMDDIDRTPEFIPYVGRMVQAFPETNRFILISSRDIFPARAFMPMNQHLLACFSLFPLTVPEMSGFDGGALPWEEGRKRHNSFMNGSFLWHNAFKGFYPALYANDVKDIHEWHRSNLAKVIDQEIRYRRKKVPPEGIIRLLSILAGKIGETLNFSEMARNLGITLHILRMWVRLLEETYQIIMLPPLLSGSRKPVIKSPKAYFTDTGMLCHVLGLRSAGETEKSPYNRNIFENMVIAEIYKRLLSQGEIPEMYFWRKATGMQVSLVVRRKSRLIPLEISMTPDREDKGIRFFKKEFGQRSDTGFIINPGKYNVPPDRGIRTIPFSRL
jgi:predicted AAA+ superfamily ATPase